MSAAADDPAAGDARLRPADPRGGPVLAPTPSNVNLPNALTLLRILLVPLLAWLLLVDGAGDVVFRLLAFTVFVVAAVTDRIDGVIARSRGLITDFGKIADPIADKLLLGSVLVIFSALGDVPWWVTVLILGRELGITLLRFWVIRYGVIAASPGGKAKTLLQIFALGGYILPFELWAPSPVAAVFEVVAAVLLYLATAVTVVTGVDYVRRALALRRAG
ncbi:MAG: CDP-diacylglycerol--glycerol-3-phosphate 3-phosphatidyltransferase [uncultured Quadrisphaera sp.]|uniref:CDP-diacylglycerol--glycerol-3-phosphate 3-phosphatidyltransferase n=1 Tax=uncultured Quadrisphaera sp. TaxID=904978 RepID=A0A6J4PLY1_9ACTN|nr:MAG: CDP-diacylglycerol--glycerol-3-phosphate 3-phosphatidyltransferase [uncultured Quadrisphaera sp.]